MQFLATASTASSAPVIVATRLRKGSTHSARGAARLVADALATTRSCGVTGTVVLRADSAFYGPEVIAAVRRSGARFSITARKDKAVTAAISRIPDNAWTTVQPTTDATTVESAILSAEQRDAVARTDDRLRPHRAGLPPVLFVIVSARLRARDRISHAPAHHLIASVSGANSAADRHSAFARQLDDRQALEVGTNMTVRPAAMAGLRARAELLSRNMAVHNASLTQIRDRIDHDLKGEMREESIARVPQYGTVYMRAMLKPVLGGVGIAAALVIVGTLANGRPPTIAWTSFIILAVLFWAAVIGAMQASEARDIAQSRALTSLQTDVQTAARKEAQDVWARAVQYRWQPTGPNPFEMGLPPDALPREWISRFTSFDAQTIHTQLTILLHLYNKSFREVMAECADKGIVPIFFTFKFATAAGVRELIDEQGAALFVTEATQLRALTSAAEIAIDVLKGAGAGTSPLAALELAWTGASAMRPYLFVGHGDLSPLEAADPIAISWMDAEHLAANFLRALGYTNVEVTQATRDGGVDVTANGLVCQVKHWSTPVPESEIQRLYGIACANQNSGAFFSAAGYRPNAITFAENANILLFETGLDWSNVRGRTAIARRVIREAR